MAHEELQTREIIGALIIEQLETDVPREILDPRIDLVYEHAARAMSNTLDHNNLFMMPVWRAVGKSKVDRPGTEPAQDGGCQHCIARRAAGHGPLADRPER